MMHVQSAKEQLGGRAQSEPPRPVHRKTAARSGHAVVGAGVAQSTLLASEAGHGRGQGQDV
jgi:hypothetical protein